jgi:hypothetical protein
MVILLSSLALASAAVGATGCGAGGHYLGGVIAHHALNHFAHTAKARRRLNQVFCLYHGHRVLVDLRTHHVFTAGLNAIAAYRACKGGFGRQR